VRAAFEIRLRSEGDQEYCTEPTPYISIRNSWVALMGGGPHRKEPDRGRTTQVRPLILVGQATSRSCKCQSDMEWCHWLVNNTRLEAPPPPAKQKSNAVLSMRRPLAQVCFPDLENECRLGHESGQWKLFGNAATKWPPDMHVL